MVATSCAGCGTAHKEGTPDCPASRLGKLVDQQYRLDSILGMGGIGVVYAATDLTLKQPVAVKMLLASFGNDAAMQERFRREAWAAARVHAHPGIVRVLRVGVTEEGNAYMVMERLEGDTLRSWFNSGPRTIGRLLWAVTSILDVLEYAHGQGLVHRDLKPSNLYVSRLGTSENVKVLDFGIVQLKWEELEALTQTGTFLGSVYYTSPEQLINSKSVTPLADIYSIGAVLFNLLTRQMVVSAPNAQMEMVSVARGDITRHPRRLVSEVPAWLDKLVAQCLSSRPVERPASARALAELLRAGAVADPMSCRVVLPGGAGEVQTLELDEPTAGTFSLTSILRGSEETREDVRGGRFGDPSISAGADAGERVTRVQLGHDRMAEPLVEEVPLSGEAFPEGTDTVTQRRGALSSEPWPEADLAPSDLTETSVLNEVAGPDAVSVPSATSRWLLGGLVGLLLLLLLLLGMGLWRLYALPAQGPSHASPSSS